MYKRLRLVGWVMLLVPRSALIFWRCRGEILGVARAQGALPSEVLQKIIQAEAHRRNSRWMLDLARWYALGSERKQRKPQNTT